MKPCQLCKLFLKVAVLLFFTCTCKCQSKNAIFKTSFKRRINYMFIIDLVKCI